MNQDIFTREQLYDLVWTEPLTALAKKFSISSFALEKICINFEIPLPSVGHWMKVKFGKNVDQTPLHSSNEINTEIIIGKSPLQTRMEEIKIHLKDALIVPQKLHSPVDLVAAAYKSMNEKDNRHWRYEGMVTSARNGLDIRVSIENISRTCRFWDSLIKCLRLRGHDIIVRGNTFVKIQNEEIKLSFREKTNKVIPDKPNWSFTEYKPNGILSLQLESFPNKEWKDGKVKIKDRLLEILAQFELIGEQMAAETIKRQKQREIEQETLRQKKELEKRRQEEIFQFKNVLDKSIRWRKAVDLRKYLNIAETKAKEENSLTDEFAQWLKWARRKADWYDPFINHEDELLGQFNIKLLTNET